LLPKNISTTKFINWGTRATKTLGKLSGIVTTASGISWTSVQIATIAIIIATAIMKWLKDKNFGK
jgi:hypothetical protein